jgi:hypothetical protein
MATYRGMTGVYWFNRFRILDVDLPIRGNDWPMFGNDFLMLGSTVHTLENAGSCEKEYNGS